MRRIKVLFVDDDIVLGKIVTLALNDAGFEIYYQTSLAAIKQVIIDIKPDIIILDVEIGEKDGIDRTPEIKILAPEVSVLFVSSHVSSNELVRGLEAGGIAYLKKPFEIEELIAYINRYTKTLPTIWYKIELGSIHFDTKENLLMKGNMKVHQLSTFESKALKLLAVNKNQIVTRKELENELWGEVKGNEHSLNNYISKLRKILSIDPQIELKTIPKAGYKLTI